MVQFGKTEEALEIARQTIAKVESLGGGGYVEIAIRTAAALSFHASGEQALPEEHLRAAVAEIERQAAAIPDTALRQRFREDVADNARARELARAFGMSV